MGPCPDFDSAHHTNDQSIVLRVAMGRRVALLPGDAEALAEGKLVARHGDRLRSDYLKVGHHGSRSSTTRSFLDTVRPAVAVISSGMRNRFGHPHPNTLASLASADVAVYRTDELGSIQWATDGYAVELQSAHYRGLRVAHFSQ
jgi:competence protein ComEC